MACWIWSILSIGIANVILLIFPFSGAKTCYNCLGERCRDGDFQKETCIWNDDVCATWKYRNVLNGTQHNGGDIYKKGCIGLLLVVEGCWPDGNYDVCLCNADSCNDENIQANSTVASVRRSRRKGLGRKFKKKRHRKKYIKDEPIALISNTPSLLNS